MMFAFGEKQWDARMEEQVNKHKAMLSGQVIQLSVQQAAVTLQAAEQLRSKAETLLNIKKKVDRDRSHVNYEQTKRKMAFVFHKNHCFDSNNQSRKHNAVMCFNGKEFVPAGQATLDVVACGNDHLERYVNAVIIGVKRPTMPKPIIAPIPKRKKNAANPSSGVPNIDNNNKVNEENSGDASFGNNGDVEMDCT